MNRLYFICVYCGSNLVCKQGPFVTRVEAEKVKEMYAPVSPYVAVVELR
jgi:hypothetical protein